MTSQQEPRVREDVRGKELRAEDAARAAADELRDVNKQRGVSGGGGEVLVEHQETRTDANRPGIIGSIFQSVTGTIGSAKDTITGKTHEATEKANIVSGEAAERETQNKDSEVRKAEEYKDSASRKAGEYKDYTAQKAGDAADKTGEYKDYTAQKARETADSAAQKTKNAKHTTMGKMGEAKDYTIDKAKDYTADKAKGAKDATMEKMGEYKDYTVDKSKEGKDNTVGTLTGLKDKAMDFFTGCKKDETKERMSESSDFSQGTGTFHETEEEAKRKLETMRLKDQGYEAKGTRMDTPEAFRKADQFTGQSFNDVGGLGGDEGKGESGGGVYRVQLKHEKK